MEEVSETGHTDHTDEPKLNTLGEYVSRVSMPISDPLARLNYRGKPGTSAEYHAVTQLRQRVQGINIGTIANDGAKLIVDVYMQPEKVVAFRKAIQELGLTESPGQSKTSRTAAGRRS